MPYATEHADALALIRENGAPVAFVHRSAGTHDAATDTFATPVTTTVSGVAVRVSPSLADRERYRLASLTPEQVVTLLFAPTTYGQTPALNATVTWAGDTLTVRDIGPVAPDGSTIIARVGCTP